jgi:uncharacterized protein (DUF302 family)
VEGEDVMREIGFEVTLGVSQDQAIDLVTEALKVEGFGVLTRIDVKATLKEKLDQDFRPYVILGACNPDLAHRALTREPRAGLLLPCNVTVESEGNEKAVVRVADPLVVLSVGKMDEDSAMFGLASEASEKLERVARSLEPHQVAG